MDKWETKVACMSLADLTRFHDDIKRQERGVEAEIKKLESKRQMHHRDAEFVAMFIRKRVPF